MPSEPTTPESGTTENTTPVDHLMAGRKNFKEATKSLNGVFDNPKRFLQSFVNFFLAFCHLAFWAMRNLRKVEVEDAANIIGSVVLMIFTGIMSVLVLILFVVRGCLRWLLDLELWQVAMGGVKLGVIAILLLAMWNWKQSLHVTWNVSRSIASAYNAGSDSAKKLAIAGEIGSLLNQKREMEKSAKQDIDFVFSDTPTPELLQVQVLDARVSFKDLREGVEKANFAIALVLDTMMRNEGSTSVVSVSEAWKAAKDKTDGQGYQKAVQSRLQLKNRIDVIDAQQEAESLRSILSNIFSW